MPRKKKPISGEEIAKFEVKKNCELPKDYRDYLIKNGNTVPDPSFFWIGTNKEDGSILENLYGLRKLASEFPDGKEGPPPDLLPIGDDEMEYTLCIGISGKRKGSVWALTWSERDFDDPSSKKGLYKVAPNFKSFLKKLRDPPDY